MVGVARFELAALRSRTVRATKLRYTPIVILNHLKRFFDRNVSFCLVARLALTEGFANVTFVRYDITPLPTCARLSVILMQPKLRYTPIVILNCLKRFFDRNVSFCLVARLALTEGFANVTFVRYGITHCQRVRVYRSYLCNPNCATPR